MSVIHTNSPPSLLNNFLSPSVLGASVGAYCFGKGLLFAANFAYENCPPHLAEKAVTFIAQNVEWIPTVFAIVGCAVAMNRQTPGPTIDAQKIIDNDQPIVVSKEKISMSDFSDKRVYGREAWQAWGVDMLDIPEPPVAKSNDENYIDIYFPEKFFFQGREFNLSNLKFADLEKISGRKIEFCFLGIDKTGFIKSLEEKGITPGWKRMSTSGIGRYTLGDNGDVAGREEAKKQLEKNQIKVQSTLEASVLALLIQANTGKCIYSNEKGRQPAGCREVWEEKKPGACFKYPVFVLFKDNNLTVHGFIPAGRDTGGNKGFNLVESF